MRYVQYPFEISSACFTAAGCCLPPAETKKVAVQWTKEQLRDLFASSDRNGDGKLSKEELMAAFKRLGSRWSSLRVRRALRHVDINGDGFVSKEELNYLIDYALECGYKL